MWFHQAPASTRHYTKARSSCRHFPRGRIGSRSSASSASWRRLGASPREARSRSATARRSRTSKRPRPRVSTTSSCRLRKSPGCPDAEFERAAMRIRQVGVQVPTTNLFLPAALKVTGPDIESRSTDGLRQESVRAAVAARHADRRLRERRGAHGARRVSRRIRRSSSSSSSAGGSRRRRGRTGITVAVEPLRPQETNIINSAAEGLALVNAIDDPNFQLMVDFYHLASVQRRSGNHRAARAITSVHLHMANPDRTRVPALAGRVRLRAVLRRAADDSIREAHQRRSVDQGSRDRRAAGDRPAATGDAVAITSAPTARCSRRRALRRAIGAQPARRRSRSSGPTPRPRAAP